MLTKVLGVDLQAVFMTMLALVGLYLVLTHAGPLNTLVSGIARSANESLVILQGRSLAGKNKVY
jgi:hypothetical protein